MDNQFTLDDGLDQTFHALADENRREALDYLVEEERSTVEGVADYLSSSAADQQLKQTELYHNHLPRLEEAEMINYDGQFVEITEDTAQTLEKLSQSNLPDNRDDLFEVLANDRRIAALNYLYENTETRVEQMAEDLGETGKEMYELHLEFEVTHLHKLEDTGLIEKDNSEIMAQEQAIELARELREIFR